MFEPSHVLTLSCVDRPGIADDFVAVGRDIESRVLARAVEYHLEARVMLNGLKTVVFQ